MNIEYVCEIHPFVQEQVCYVRTNDGYKVAGIVQLKDLCSYLVNCCYSGNTKKIHLVGPASYLKKLCEDIKYEETCHFGNCDIEIEVN